jgi:hypothetical protein
MPEPSLLGSSESCDTCPDKSISWRTLLEGGFGKPETGVVLARVVIARLPQQWLVIGCYAYFQSGR